MNTRVSVDKDHWTTIVVSDVNGAVVDFKIYEITGMSPEENEIFYRLKGSAGCEFTDKLDQAEALFSGMVKFDGCINLIFDAQDDCAAHFCGNPAEKFKYMFDRLYQLASELMPDHNLLRSKT